MPAQNGLDFEGEFNNAIDGLFKNNTTRDISPTDQRALVTAIRESYVNRLDDAYTFAFPQVSTSGTNTYTATPSPAISAYANTQAFKIKFTNASSGPSTLNLNGLGAKKLYVNPTTQADTGDVVDEQVYLLIYDAALDSASGGFLMIGGSGGGGGGVTSVNGDSGPSVTLVASEIGSTAAGTIAATNVQAALEELDADKIPVKVRNDVTLANGVVTINWAAGDIQNLTISEAKVITTISNPVVGETIILIIPGTNSLTFSGLTAVIEGTYESGVTNRIYIQCLKVSGGAEYRITYDHDSSPFPFATLTDGATVTWTVASLEAISNRLLTIGGNRTLAISGALSGYSGNVKITASGSDRTITIPAGTSHRMKGVGDTTVKTVTIPIGETYIFTWLYDGTNYDWWYID